jgi:5-(carboxyamino)imidazole ribonucleotide synthase
VDDGERRPVVGMVGAGQLARMTHEAASALGLSLRVLATAPDDSAALVTPDLEYGQPDDLAALQAFAKRCDVVTFDHEHVPGAHIAALVAEGATVYPAAAALRFAQDKRAMRERLQAHGTPVPAWRAVQGSADVVALAEEVGWPLVAKATHGGYDGRGVWVVDDAAAVDRLLANGVEILVEQRVPLRRELAALVARSPSGEVVAYPVVETVQRDGICVEVLAPAPAVSEAVADEARRLATELAGTLGVVGLLAVELFDTGDGLLVNELAMRPHNSGHWTIEGSRTSQFEQHLRAVLDLPLGDTGPTAPATAMANVLGGEPGGPSLDERLRRLFAADPAAKVHLYGKQPRPGRKLGHVTVVGDDPDDVRRRARRAARWLEEGR